MKAIIFDIDWVVIKSDNKKQEIIYKILDECNILNVNWVKEILALWINRILLLEKIYEIVSFNKEEILEKINYEYAILENNPEWNFNIINFIKNNSDKYLFFTNTSLPEAWLKRVLSALKIEEKFKELLSFDSGNKIDNINHVLNEYNLEPEEVLFIDDNIKMINFTEDTQVNRLYFNDFEIDIEKYIQEIKN